MPTSQDDLTSLVSIIEDSITTPSEVIKKGRVPVPIFIGLEPSSDDQSQSESFAHLMEMSAMVRLFAGLSEVQKRQASDMNEAISITNPKEIGLAFAHAAEATSAAVTEGTLASFYTMEAGTTQNIDTTISRADLHKAVLNSIFGGLPDNSPGLLKSMDSILTDFVHDIKSFHIQQSPDQPDVEQCILINYVKTTDLTGDNSSSVIEPYTRMAFIKVKTDCWNNALHKPGLLGRNSKIAFDMSCVVTDMKMNEAKFNASKAKFLDVFLFIGGQAESVKEIIQNGGLEGFGRRTSILETLS